MAATYAPDSLQAARRLLLAHLPGLTSLEVGIVGDTAHADGGDSYHLGKGQIRDRNGRDRYSVDESSRDRNGLSNAASALDIGTFAVAIGGKRHDLRTFSVWLVAQCKANTADTRDIREVIYSPDGSTVKRWDRLGIRSSGDSSHTFHTHISYFRDSESRDKTGLFRRYLTEIGLLEAPVTPADVADIWTTDGIIPAPANAASAATNTHWTPGSFLKDSSELGRSNAQALARVEAGLAAILAKVSGDLVDEQQIVTGVLAGLDPAAIAAAIPAELAEQVANELAARLAS
ncbi:hypothetical protein Q0Z83_060070 [Actinoplanes sichuanensis]|uniref:Uncharacterized protein n=1 Tax=Actinoplanes sichuanensis TaxID=512349 RepID=A0ABW4A6Q0_9ACTN|nr:hypothetical protein [Actinoplanes sichuanensis]BEL07816.1 hypothetical protein Q0Z83_060070 [Actinoplanes sichuanensis]